MYGQIAPTAGTAVLTATPSMPVRGQRATIENVLSSGIEAGSDALNYWTRQYAAECGRAIQ